MSKTQKVDTINPLLSASDCTTIQEYSINDCRISSNICVVDNHVSSKGPVRTPPTNEMIALTGNHYDCWCFVIQETNIDGEVISESYHLTPEAIKDTLVSQQTHPVRFHAAVDKDYETFLLAQRLPYLGHEKDLRESLSKSISNQDDRFFKLQFDRNTQTYSSEPTGFIIEEPIDHSTADKIVTDHLEPTVLQGFDDPVVTDMLIAQDKFFGQTEYYHKEHQYIMSLYCD